MINKKKSTAVLWCIKHKIIVYPVLASPGSKKYKIESIKEGKKHTFDKEIDKTEIDSAIEKTYKYYYDKTN